MAPRTVKAASRRASAISAPDATPANVDASKTGPEAHFLKTKLCKFFMQGLCSRGSECGYAHRRSEMKPLPDFFRTRLCPKMLQDGTCEDGAHCKYAHAQEDLRKAVTRKAKAMRRKDDKIIEAWPDAALPAALQKSKLNAKEATRALPPPSPVFAQRQCMQVGPESPAIRAPNLAMGNMLLYQIPNQQQAYEEYTMQMLIDSCEAYSFSPQCTTTASDLSSALGESLCSWEGYGTSETDEDAEQDAETIPMKSAEEIAPSVVKQVYQEPVGEFKARAGNAGLVFKVKNTFLEFEAKDQATLRQIRKAHSEPDLLSMC